MSLKKIVQNFVPIGIKKRNMLMKVKGIILLTVFTLSFPLFGIAQQITVKR
jgi:hypothetical protein